MESKRATPRYPCKAPLYIFAQGGALPSASKDISSNGVSLFVDADTLGVLKRQGQYLNVGDAVQLSPTQVALPSNLIECRVRFLRRLSRDNYLLVVRWADDAEAADGPVRKMLEEAQRS